MPTSMRTTIARYMAFSKQTIPHFYLTRYVDMTAALSWRQIWNAEPEHEVHVSINDLFIRATALALIAHPNFNGHYENETFQPWAAINLGVAISLPDGLIAPAILDCGALKLEELAKRSRDLADRARNGKLTAKEYRDATFTVSNLGMFKVATFTAIIVPPQVAILAVGGVEEVFAPVEGAAQIVKRVALTLSADHRVVDGADGAQFLAGIAACLQNPDQLFVQP